MAIAEMNYLQNAHRLSLYEVAPSVTDVHPGQHFHLNDQSQWEYADGSKKSYPTLNSRYPGTGYGSIQGERNEGRDDVSRARKITCLRGNFEIGTDQYDKEATYETGKPIVVADNTDTSKGQVTAAADANTKPIVGYVTHVPTDDEDFLYYEQG